MLPGGTRVGLRIPFSCTGAIVFCVNLVGVRERAWRLGRLCKVVMVVVGFFFFFFFFLRNRVLNNGRPRHAYYCLNLKTTASK